MELFQLRYFMKVAKYENFSKASEELLISQPSVSKAISQLEDEFGIPLFERTGKRIKLNNAGLTLQKRLSGIIAAIDNLPNELKVAAGATQSTINFNILAASSLIPELLYKFRQEYPLVNFELIQTDKSTKCDLCIISTLPYVFLNNGTLLLSEELKLAVPANSPLALLDSVDLSDLKDENFLMLNKSHGLRDITLHFFEMCGYQPKIGFESDSPYTIRDLVAAGLGITIWPELTWGKMHSDRAKLISIKNPICMRNIFMTWKDDTQISREAQYFLDFAKKYFNQLIS